MVHPQFDGFSRLSETRHKQKRDPAPDVPALV